MGGKPQQHAELAQQAAEQWSKGAFVECAATLESLAKQVDKQAGASDAEEGSARAAAAKVMHNAALATFASAKNPDAGQLLEKIAKTSELLQEESARAGASSTGGGAKGGANTGQSKSADGASAGPEGGVSKARFQPDASFALYNRAVVQANKRQWRSALDILENLFRYIDALDEGLALCICFLLLDVYTLIARGAGPSEGGLLVSHVAEQAQSVVDYLEKPHAFNARALDGNAESSKGGGTNQQKGVNDASDGQQQQQQQGQQRAWDMSQVIAVLRRLVNYKAKILLTQAGTAGTTATTVQRAEEFLAQANEVNAQISEPTTKGKAETWEGLKLLPSKEGGVEPATKATPQALEVISDCLRANVAYLKEDYQACSDSLQAATAKGLNKSISLNNMGCIQHCHGRHHCAAVIFAKALEAAEHDTQQCKAEISFNLAVQLLHCGKPALAYESFMRAAPAAYHRPRLWLHVAECVVMAHAQAADREGRAGLLHSVIGEGAERRILLDTGPAHATSGSATGTGSAAQSANGNGGSSSSTSSSSHRKGKSKSAKSGGKHARSAGGGPAESTTSGNGGSGNANASELSLEAGIRATCHVLYLLNILEDGSLPSGPSSSSSSTAATSQSRISGPGLAEGEATSVASAAAVAAAAAAASSADGAGGLSNGKLVAGLDSSGDASRMQTLAMRQTALLCQSYLALQIGDWALAYNSSRQVVDLAASSADAKKALDPTGLAAAHAYCAEASLRSGAMEGDSFKPALDHVAKAMETELANSRGDDAVLGGSGASPAGERARAALCTNLALVRILKSDLAEAERLLLRALDMVPDFAHAMRLLVYLCLSRGEQDRARRLLKTSR